MCSVQVERRGLGFRGNPAVFVFVSRGIEPGQSGTPTILLLLVRILETPELLSIMFAAGGCVTE